MRSSPAGGPLYFVAAQIVSGVLLGLLLVGFLFHFAAPRLRHVLFRPMAVLPVILLAASLSALLALVSFATSFCLRPIRRRPREVPRPHRLIR